MTNLTNEQENALELCRNLLPEGYTIAPIEPTSGMMKMSNGNEWHVYTPDMPHADSRVLIEPPLKVDKEFDDLMLEVTGNMLREDKERIAQIICDTLNTRTLPEGYDELMQYAQKLRDKSGGE